MTYEEIRPTLKSGDVILFSGKGVISTAIKWATHSRWSHVGMVVKTTKYDIILSWESTTLTNVKDVESGTIKSGVMLLPLSHRISTYNGEIGIRPLREPLAKQDHRILECMRHEVRDIPYEKDMIEFVKAAYDGPFGMNTEDLRSIFCSELIAEFFIRIERLSKKLPSNEYTQEDFANDSMNSILKDLIMIAA